jgi:hypothetical protein
MPRAILVPVALAGLLVVAVAVRLAVLNVPGHDGDVMVMARWAEAMARYGPGQFYQHDNAIYPALLYAYWPLGLAFDGQALTLAIKGLSIPFDVGVALALFGVGLRFGAWRALAAPALYLFNPAVLLAGPVWGQVDAAGTLAYLLTLLALAGGRFGPAGALAVVAALTKPQFGLVALPVAVVALIRWRRDADRAPAAWAAVGAAAAYAVICLPLWLNPIAWLSRVGGAAAFQPMSSLNAPNLWGVFVGYKVPDEGFVWVGAGLALLGFAAALLPLRRRQDLAAVLTAGIFLVFAFYFLPTRVHERYLFPAMALLAPLAVTSGRVLIGYLLLSGAFAMAMLYALVSTTPFTLPEPWEGLLLQRMTSVGIGLAMMASAALLVVMLVRFGGAHLGGPRGSTG